MPRASLFSGGKLFIAFKLLYQPPWNERLTVYDRDLYNYLRSVAGGDDYGSSFRKKATMAADTGVSVRQIAVSRQRLSRWGLLVPLLRFNKGHQSSNHYVLFDPDNPYSRDKREALEALVSELILKDGPEWWYQIPKEIDEIEAGLD